MDAQVQHVCCFQQDLDLPPLPDDLWAVITSNLDHFELKQLRLVSRSLQTFAAFHLFRTIILRPNSDSLDRALNVAESPNLAGLVRGLELRAESVFQDFEAVAAYMTCETQYLAKEGSSNGNDDYLAVDFAKYALNRPVLTAAENRYSQMTEYEQLDSLCSQLRNLQFIDRVSFSPSLGVASATSMFPRQFGLRVVTRSQGFAVDNVMGLVKPSGPLSLRFRTMHWVDLRPTRKAAGLRHLRKLDLHLELMYWQRGVDDANFGTVASFLDALEAIQELNLSVYLTRLDSMGSRPLAVDSQHGLVSFWKFILRKDWRHLRSLSLHNIVCIEHDLLYFLARHSNILKTLRLSDLSLHNILGGGHMSLDSILRTLWILPHIVRLDSFSTNGYLKACNSEHWISDSSEDLSQRSRRRRMHEYVCGRAEFPFPKLIDDTRHMAVLAAMQPLLKVFATPTDLKQDDLQMLEEEVKDNADRERLIAIENGFNVGAAMKQDEKDDPDVDMSWDCRVPEETCDQRVPDDSAEEDEDDDSEVDDEDQEEDDYYGDGGLTEDDDDDFYNNIYMPSL